MGCLLVGRTSPASHGFFSSRLQLLEKINCDWNIHLRWSSWRDQGRHIYTWAWYVHTYATPLTSLFHMFNPPLGALLGRLVESAELLLLVLICGAPQWVERN